MNYIVLDLEATCSRVGDVEHETIEIGAVKVNEYGKIVSYFESFVKPIKNPILTDFCTELTTIQQQDVDAAPKFVEAVAQFREWIGEEPYLLVSWGYYDKQQLKKDCQENGLDDSWVNEHLSLKHEYTKIKKLKRPIGAKKAVQQEGFSFTGTHHRGIDDAKNVARIFIRYQKELLQA